MTGVTACDVLVRSKAADRSSDTLGAGWIGRLGNLPWRVGFEALNALVLADECDDPDHVVLRDPNNRCHISETPMVSSNTVEYRAHV